MKHLLPAGILLFTLLSTTSCRYHRGLTTNTNEHQTQVVMEEKNYTVVKYVEGAASARYFLGIGGGNSERGLIARAREAMLRNAGLLGKSRAVINETVEISSKQFLVYTEFRYVVSAYIIEFYDPEKETAPLAEENSYAEPEKPHSPNVHSRWLNLAYAVPEASYYNWNQTVNTGPGLIAAFRTEYSNPDLRYLFWETQMNLVYLNWDSYTNNRLSDEEQSLGFELPFLIGLKFPLPVIHNIRWFVKGGPFISATLVNRKVFNYSQAGNLVETYYDRETGALLTLGAKIGLGLQLGQRWQAEFGHRFTIGWGEYDYTHFGLSYRL